MGFMLFFKLAASVALYNCAVSSLKKVLSGNRDKELQGLGLLGFYWGGV